MDIVWKKSSSGEYPRLVDTESSAHVSYVRRNVEAKTVRDDMHDGEEYTVYEYEEARLTKEQFALYMASQESEEAVLSVQEAIAELAELQEANHTAMQEAIAELAEAMLNS